MIFSIEDIARICYEAVQALGITQGYDGQTNWDHAPQWQKDSVMETVEFKINNPSIGHLAWHHNWMRRKMKDGWVCGETIDEVKKTDTNLVHFNHLPPEQKAKYHLFCAIVEGLLQFEGKQA